MHCVWEIVDNAVDEALAGFCDEIRVILDADNVVTVIDNGRGIPTGMHATGVPTPVLVYTKLHAGGKFGGGGYSVSGGLHGVGAAVVNALSEWVELTIFRNGTTHRVTFSEGGSTVSELEALGSTRKRGTTVRFKPDVQIFGRQKFVFGTFINRCRELAFLVPGLTFRLEDRTREEPLRAEFKFDGGIADFVRFMNESRVVAHDPIHFKGQVDEISVEVALQYNEGYAETILSFVNCINTVEGGFHETGFKSAHTRVMNEYARRLGIWKKKDNLSGEDLREGMMAVISLRMPEVEFEGQTKTKLGNSEARTAVEQVVADHLAAFLEENPDLATGLLERASRACEAREKARKVREATRAGKDKGFKASLDGKLTRCASRTPERCELFIVEGDSAGGSAKQGRDREFQAILPLRGKPLNTERAPLEKILKNNEISSIVQTLGTGIGQDFSLQQLRYHKIVLLSDADDDGAHIRCLLLTFFYRFMRPLITNGMIYIACPPLFRIFTKSSSRYAWTTQEMQETKGKMGRHASVQRFKGLGEMNADQLWDTTLNPESRTLMQVTIDDASNAERYVSILMGSHSEPRRDWIVENVEFGVEEATVPFDTQEVDR
ncbi:MAG: DNA gyrase subunit B [Myxococcales bacterium]|nr:DNA gyrase subunit B [Myxococcales bacterium]